MSNDLMEQFMKKSINFYGLNTDIKYLLTLQRLALKIPFDASVTRKKITRKVAQAVVFYGVPAQAPVSQISTGVTVKDASL